MQPKPFLKWAGGKTVSCELITSELPASISTYWEPCLGAGAVFFALARELPIPRFRAAVLSDSSRELVETTMMVRDDVSGVIDCLQRMRPTEKQYYEVRASRPKSPQRRAARMIYLNHLAYNGLYRVNRQGQFNVPFGDYYRPVVCNVEVLEAASKALQVADIVCSDFAIARGAKAVDAVYFDPPYIPTSSTSRFCGYVSNGFDERDQMRLARLVTQLGLEGVAVVASNADCPAARDLYSGHQIRRLEVGRSINSKGGKRGKVGELLVTAIRMTMSDSLLTGTGFRSPSILRQEGIEA